jgi:hypothetical protein
VIIDNIQPKYIIRRERLVGYRFDAFMISCWNLAG